METNNLISLEEMKLRNEKLSKLKSYKRYLKSLADLNQLHEEASFIMRDMSLSLEDFKSKMGMILDQMMEDPELTSTTRSTLKNQRLKLQDYLH